MDYIPEKVYQDIEIENAKFTLYKNGVTPKQYAKFCEQEFGKDYALEQMADARDMQRELMAEGVIPDDL